MSCNNCTNAKAIPQCSEVLTLGTIDPLITDAVIVITEIKSGRQRAVTATINLSNEVSFDMTTMSYFYSPNLSYSIQVFDGATLNVNAPVDVVVGGESYECFNFNIRAIYDENDEIIGQDFITLELL